MICVSIGRGRHRHVLAEHRHLVEEGARVLGDGQPKTGAHGLPVVFLHPKDFCGTLVELEQVNA